MLLSLVAQHHSAWNDMSSFCKLVYFIDSDISRAIWAEIRARVGLKLSSSGDLGLWQRVFDKNNFPVHLNNTKGTCIHSQAKLY